MYNDLLSDFEKIQHYKKQLKRSKGVLLVFTILSFILGCVVARAYYLVF